MLARRRLRPTSSRTPASPRTGFSASCTRRTSIRCWSTARLAEDNSIFCLYTRTASGLGYDPKCFAAPGPVVAGPPYASPEPIAPHGTYTPIWQRYVGYFVTSTPDGLYALQRVVGDLSTPDSPLSLSVLAGGDTVATLIQSFDVSVTGGVVAVTLKAKGTEVVQGRTLPAQEILLPGQSLTRN